jgi:Ca2+-binding RTX toxin-like protein
LDGGNGNDVLIADTTALAQLSVFAVNRLDGGNGNDSLTAHMVANTGSQSLHGVEASNVLSGGSGDDSASASIEIQAFGASPESAVDISNTLDGGVGNDYLEASINVIPVMQGLQSVENHLDGGAGNDVLVATIVGGTSGSSFLTGGNGNDQLTVVGGSGNVLNGGEGRDSLTGGTGDDFLFGGKGGDTFHFDLSANQGTDTIGDFESERDILMFAGLIDQGAPGLVDDLNAISSITDSGAGNDVTVDFTSGSHIVFAGLGTGFTDSWGDIVAHPALQLTV